MTTGAWMVANSSRVVAMAWEHLVNPECILTKIKSFKVVYAPKVLTVSRELPTYKIVVTPKVYKIVYVPSPVSVVRLVENTIVKKGC